MTGSFDAHSLAKIRSFLSHLYHLFIILFIAKKGKKNSNWVLCEASAQNRVIRGTKRKVGIVNGKQKSALFNLSLKSFISKENYI
ncbi:hypothetical protein BpHYR1_004488 [Brachionus plicatilis]|uniref:Uncharacterized protein n=1 Tax=Brachionus plicatilis TaxID=10195 RepID=A0A3M7SA81_BRAPC|nr:hypothetical protein BpHYR1_004488 [Brachionus plicatilis]